ncbi:MAG: hypothetical protein COV47_01930 [Candidatus Diapherotrites archaeon CG11_big_fil_rev_8_21_14_0_20_37_9]|nr:MAG: hypothetical protein COV47_01930 [Candidatus Diapherotrites archaeon CG11_big_fil_rev_8_21_14_0_20_37_9]
MRYGFLFCVLILFSSFALAVNFETASVGRIQGDSLDDLSAALETGDLDISGANYYTDDYFAQPGSGNGYAIPLSDADLLNAVLGEVYGPNNVHSFDSWDFKTVEDNPVSSTKLLIVQSRGDELGDQLYVHDGQTSKGGIPKKVSGFNLGNAIDNGALVISDVEFSGTYLPYMAKNDSFVSQLAGKASALISTNGIRNPSLVKSIVCSLALEERSFGKNNYYQFNTLGDRFRNARNNLKISNISGNNSVISDYYLSGLPYTKVDGKKEDYELERLCGNFAEYNVFPFESSSPQSVLMVLNDGESESVLTRNLSFDFSDYEVITENDFDLLDVNETIRDYSLGALALPYAVAEIPFPLATIVSNVEVVSYSNPITLTLRNLPSNGEGGFVDRFCSDNNSMQSADFSDLYVEDKKLLVATINPVEVVDCEQGIFRLYRNVEVKVDYSPYSPVLIKSRVVDEEFLPGDIVDVGISLENITPNQAQGNLKLLDGNTIVAEKAVNLGSGENKGEFLSFEAASVEGFYDYDLVFEQFGEEKTRTNFKVKVDKLKVGLAFDGSRDFFDDFESAPLDYKWDVLTNYSANGTTPSISVNTGGGSLNISSSSYSSSSGIGHHGDVSGKVVSKNGFESRFSLDDLPLVIDLGEVKLESQISEMSNGLTLKKDFSGQLITLEKQGDSEIFWSRSDGNSGVINLSGWDANNLGFDFFAKSYSNQTGNAMSTSGEIYLKIIDSADSVSGNYFDLLSASQSRSNTNAIGRYYKTYAVFHVNGIYRPFPVSARGTAYNKVFFENKSNAPIDAVLKYVLTDGESVLDSGELPMSILKGDSSKTIQVPNLSGFEKDYEMVVEVSYENRSKIAANGFEGNNAPVISAPSYIFADAFDSVALDYSISDPDADEIDYSVSEPFSVSSVWNTTDLDEGIHEVTIIAFDGIEETTKNITVEVGPPKVECSFNYDCGETLTVKARACTDGLLYAEEKVPVCNNAGTFTSYCSYEDNNRFYGVCELGDSFSDGSGSKVLRFEEEGEKIVFIEIPRKAIVDNASIRVKADSKVNQCFNTVDYFNHADGFAEKYVFANGTSFVGAHFRGEVLASSNYGTSDMLENFPPIRTPQATAAGVLSRGKVVVAGSNSGPAGSFIQVNAGCAASRGGTSSGNFKNWVNRTIDWIEIGFKQPTSDPNMNYFCTWEDGPLSFQTGSFSSVYNHAYGSWAGIGDPGSPAHEIYVNQFQSGSEYYLGDVDWFVKDVNFSASEDLFGMSIDYFVTNDGETWVPVEVGESENFSILDSERAFNWKAVFNTTHPGITPRLYSTDLCVETFGNPKDVSINIGSVPVWFFSGNGFDKEIDITEELNSYLASLPVEEGDVLVPVSVFGDSEGIVEFDGISVEFDVHNNTAPVIEPIADQYALAGEPFALEINAFDFEGDVIAFSDDTHLFDVNNLGLVLDTAYGERAYAVNQTWFDVDFNWKRKLDLVDGGNEKLLELRFNSETIIDFGNFFDASVHDGNSVIFTNCIETERLSHMKVSWENEDAVFDLNSGSAETEECVFMYYGNDSNSEDHSTELIVQGETVFSDDFSDMDYTNSPAWNVESGTWSAANGNLDYNQAGTDGKIYTSLPINLNEAYTTWNFAINRHGTGNIFVIVAGTGETHNMNTEPGYDLYIDASSGKPYFRYHDGIGNNVNLITGQNGDVPDSVETEIMLTRTPSGTWEMFLNNNSRGTENHTLMTNMNELWLDFRSQGTYSDDVQVCRSTNATCRNANISNNGFTVGERIHSKYTGIISFTPKKEDVGIYNITIIASDGELSSEETFRLNIIHINTPPSLTATMDNNTFSEGDIVQIDFNAFDAEGDDLNISLNLNPPADSNGFILDGNSFLWQTIDGDAGDYNFTLIVSDGNLSDSLFFSISVLDNNALCFIDSDCGIDDYIDLPFCSTDLNISQTYRHNFCLNAGTLSASCGYEDIEQVIFECQDSFICSSGFCLEIIPPVVPLIEMDSNFALGSAVGATVDLNEGAHVKDSVDRFVVYEDTRMGWMQVYYSPESYGASNDGVCQYVDNSIDVNSLLDFSWDQNRFDSFGNKTPSPPGEYRLEFNYYSDEMCVVPNSVVKEFDILPASLCTSQVSAIEKAYPFDAKLKVVYRKADEGTVANIGWLAREGQGVTQQTSCEIVSENCVMDSNSYLCTALTTCNYPVEFSNWTYNATIKDEACSSTSFERTILPFDGQIAEMYYEPIQCGLNPWEQWALENKLKGTREDFVNSYYSDVGGIDLSSIFSVVEYTFVCRACSCSDGTILNANVDLNFKEGLEKLGWQEKTEKKYAVCGNAVCETWLGENALACKADCGYVAPSGSYQ